MALRFWGPRLREGTLATQLADAVNMAVQLSLTEGLAGITVLHDTVLHTYNRVLTVKLNDYDYPLKDGSYSRNSFVPKWHMDHTPQAISGVAWPSFYRSIGSSSKISSSSSSSPASSGGAGRDGRSSSSRDDNFDKDIPSAPAPCTSSGFRSNASFISSCCSLATVTPRKCPSQHPAGGIEGLVSVSDGTQLAQLLSSLSREPEES